MQWCKPTLSMIAPEVLNNLVCTNSDGESQVCSDYNITSVIDSELALQFRISRETALSDVCETVWIGWYPK